MRMTKLHLRCVPAGVYITELLLIFMGGYFAGKYAERKAKDLEKDLCKAVKDRHAKDAKNAPWDVTVNADDIFSTDV